MALNIVADDKIPLVKEWFDTLGQVTLISGSQIRQEHLLQADVLLTRTVTAVNADLLANTPVQFVGSATAGYDHIDTDWLTQHHITWAYAAGVNATAVAEYVICCVAELRKQNLLPKNNCRAAIIGVGHIGSTVANYLKKVGIQVIYNDPPRAQQEADFISVPLSELTDADLICIHTPLTQNAPFATYHLINDEFLSRLKPGCVLLNAGRGENVDTHALLRNKHVIACLDVWENEPHINLDILNHATIATPHIAGYSQQAKINATKIIYQRVLNYFRLTGIPTIELPTPEKKIIDITGCSTWEDIVLQTYQPTTDQKKMQATLLNHPKDVANLFEKIRREYSLRPEFSTIQLTPIPPQNLSSLLKSLNYNWQNTNS